MMGRDLAHLMSWWDAMMIVAPVPTNPLPQGQLVGYDIELDSVYSNNRWKRFGGVYTLFHILGVFIRTEKKILKDI